MVGCQRQQIIVIYDMIWAKTMGIATSEKELAGRVSRFLKAEMKRAGVTYADLATRLKDHGLEETEASIASKLARGTFAATFMLAVLAALEVEHLTLAQL